MCITLTSSTFCCQARHLNCFFFFKYRTLPSKRNELNTELSIPSRAGHRKADCFKFKKDKENKSETSTLAHENKKGDMSIMAAQELSDGKV